MTAETSSQIQLTTAAPRLTPLSGNNEAEIDRNEDGRLEFSLPRVDGGKEAWLFLAGSFFIEALVWGRTMYFFDGISM